LPIIWRFGVKENEYESRFNEEVFFYGKEGIGSNRSSGKLK